MKNRILFSIYLFIAHGHKTGYWRLGALCLCFALFASGAAKCTDGAPQHGTAGGRSVASISGQGSRLFPAVIIIFIIALLGILLLSAFGENRNS